MFSGQFVISHSEMGVKLMGVKLICYISLIFHRSLDHSFRNNFLFLKVSSVLENVFFLYSTNNLVTIKSSETIPAFT